MQRIFRESQMAWWNTNLPSLWLSEYEPLQTEKKGEFKGLYKCKGCRERFTVTVGSMFEGSYIGLRNWFIAIYMFSSHKKGISSHQLSRDVGITQKSAWFMLSRIRHAYEMKPYDRQWIGITQVDETYVGGKNKNRHGEKKIKNS